MATFVALYPQPEDPAAFERYYRDTHLPIVERWPGLQSASVTRLTGTPRGAAPAYHLMALFTFASDEGMSAALRSDAGTEAAEDLQTMAERFGITPTLLLGVPFPGPGGD